MATFSASAWCMRAAANRAAMTMNFIHEFSNILRRRELRNAVAEIENVARMIAEAVEHGAGFHADCGRRRKQYRRIDIALQRHLATHALARLAQVHGPVEPHRIHADIGDLVEPQPAALRE